MAEGKTAEEAGVNHKYGLPIDPKSYVFPAPKLAAQMTGKSKRPAESLSGTGLSSYVKRTVASPVAGTNQTVPWSVFLFSSDRVSLYKFRYISACARGVSRQQ